MTNMFNMACPSCGQQDSIDIIARVAVRLCSDGTDPYEARCGDHDWDRRSQASCGCGWHGLVGALIVHETKVA
jgi:hypothetical protein